MAGTFLEISGATLETPAASIVTRGVSAVGGRAFLSMRRGFIERSPVIIEMERRSMVRGGMSRETFWWFIETLRRSWNYRGRVVINRAEVVINRRNITRDAGEVIDKPRAHFSYTARRSCETSAGFRETPGRSHIYRGLVSINDWKVSRVVWLFRGVPKRDAAARETTARKSARVLRDARWFGADWWFGAATTSGRLQA